MKARVLIVEDNAINRALMDYLLRSFGFETLSAVDGAVGLDVACRERPDLILCDIQMPVMDGFEFVMRIRAMPDMRPTPVIAVTALAMVGDRDRVLAKGFDAYISKPVDATEFIDTLSNFLPLPQRATDFPKTPPHYPVSTTAPATILVLDDSPFNLELKRGLLEPHGYRVITVDAASRALQLAREHLPALIISDVGMSEGSGFDFIRAVKGDSALAEIPFIFLSSTHWNEASRTLGLSLGAIRYLLRPMEAAALLAEIEECLRANFLDGPKAAEN